MRNMSVALLRHETIRTTLPKAKELRRVVEPLITLAKTDSEARRRLAFARLRDQAIVDKLFADLGPRFKARAGGYTRILRMMPRAGDAAPMALMQLVDQAAAPAVEAAAPAKKGKRPGSPSRPGTRSAGRSSVAASGSATPSGRRTGASSSADSRAASRPGTGQGSLAGQPPGSPKPAPRKSQLASSRPMPLGSQRPRTREKWLSAYRVAHPEEAPARNSRSTWPSA